MNIIEICFVILSWIFGLLSFLSSYEYCGLNKFSCGYLFYVVMGTYLKVELLAHMVALYLSF